MRILFAVLAALSLALGGSGLAHAKEQVRLAFIGPEGDAWLGFRQAVDEANRQGRFLGFEFGYATSQTVDGEALAGAHAVFSALPSAAFEELAQRYAGKPVFNLAAPDEGLREACLPNAFHTPATPRMRADALVQWQRAGNELEGVETKVWNTQFRRYAAIQLSVRFAEGQGVAMTDQAYAGWAGTRLYTQVVMEVGDPAAGPMVAALRSDEVQFDGAKGVPMRFRPSGQLDQMLLLEREGKVLGSAPVRGLHAAYELRTLGFNGCQEMSTP